MRLAYVLGFALLLSAFAATRPAKADDVFYVPLTTAERLEAAEARIAALEAAIARMQPPAVQKPAPPSTTKSSSAKKLPDTTKATPSTGPTGCCCNTTTTVCGCPNYYPACTCAAPGVVAPAPFGVITPATPAPTVAGTTTTLTFNRGVVAAPTATPVRVAHDGITGMQYSLPPSGGCANGQCQSPGRWTIIRRR